LQTGERCLNRDVGSPLAIGIPYQSLAGHAAFADSVVRPRQFADDSERDGAPQDK
jgi:hypothetical protein